MKNHSYRCLELQEVNVEKITSSVGAAPVVVAIDVAKTKMVAAIASGAGAPLAIVKWRQPAQTMEFVSLVKALGACGRVVTCVMEPTGTYGDALRYQLESVAVPVHLVSANHVHDAAEIYDGVPSKHDAKDAAVIAWLHAQGKTRPWPQRDEKRRTLRALITERELYYQPMQRTLNKLGALLARHFPEADEVFALERQKSAWAVLSALPSPARMADDSDETRRILQRASYNNLSREAIERVVIAARTSTGVPMCDAEQHLLQRFVQEIARCSSECDRVDEDIAAVIASEPSWTEMRAVLGAVTLAVVLAHVGEPASFTSANALQKAMGLNLREHSSGNRKGALHITKRGPGIVRRYLHFAAMRLIYTHPVAEHWYRQRKQYLAGHHLAALTAVMRKIASSLIYVARGTPFEATKLFDARAFPDDIARAPRRRRTMKLVAPMVVV